MRFSEDTSKNIHPYSLFLVKYKEWNGNHDENWAYLNSTFFCSIAENKVTLPLTNTKSTNYVHSTWLKEKFIYNANNCNLSCNVFSCVFLLIYAFNTPERNEF